MILYSYIIYNKKKICIDEAEILDSKVTKKFYRFLRELEELGYVKIDGNYVTSVKKIDAVTKNFIAVEAKISDWKLGLEQAVMSNTRKNVSPDIVETLLKEGAYSALLEDKEGEEGDIGIGLDLDCFTWCSSFILLFFSCALSSVVLVELLLIRG